MIRLLLAIALAFAFAGPAWAQVPDETVLPDVLEETGDVREVTSGEVLGDSGDSGGSGNADEPGDSGSSGEGAEDDDAGDAGGSGNAGDGEDGRGGQAAGRDVAVLPASQLPLTGGEPTVLALLGLGLLMGGAGARLLLMQPAAARSGGRWPPRSPRR